jgi:hypothetical protein
MSNEQNTAPPRDVYIPALLIVVMIALSAFDGFRHTGEAKLDGAAERAIAAFAVARTINGVISVVQETQVGVSLGINTTLAPGQILDPMNDLIERFSTVALIAATLLWALKLLGGFLVLPWIPLFLGLLLAIRLLLPPTGIGIDIRQALMRAIRIGILIWGFAALTPWVIDGLHHSDVIQMPYAEANESMQTAGAQLGALAKIESPWDIDRDELRDTMQQLSTMADRLSRQAIIVLAVFVFEVLLVPLAIFWIGSRLLLRAPPAGSG